VKRVGSFGFVFFRRLTHLNVEATTFLKTTVFFVFLNLRFLPLFLDGFWCLLKGLRRFYELPPMEFPGLARLRATRKGGKEEKKERRKRPAFDFSRKEK